MKKILINMLILSSLGFTGCGQATAKASTVKTSISQVSQTTQQPQTSNLQYYFTRANQHPDQELIKVIDSSTKTLDIAIYSLTKQSIVDSIIRAKSRGVDVEIMTDKIESKGKSEAKELVLLKAANIPIKINSHSGLLHIKMTIADNKIATTGSYNYSAAASKINDEILVIISDPKVATDFDNEFKSMWSNTKDYKDYE